MTLHLTPEMLEAAYNFLKTTPPFKSWKLPDSDDVRFIVSRDRVLRGVCSHGGDDPEISISTSTNGHLISLSDHHPTPRLRHHKLLLGLPLQRFHVFEGQTYNVTASCAEHQAADVTFIFSTVGHGIGFLSELIGYGWSK